MTEANATDQTRPPPLRQCGRCRLFFPTTGDLHPAELKQWWACDDCSARIIPNHRRVDASGGVPAQDGAS